MSVVLDASALLAYLRDEAGAEVVEEALDLWVAEGRAAASVGAVNWIEVCQRVADPAVLRDLGTAVAVVPLDREVAEIAAGLLAPTRPLGLSLADRACLALAIHRGVPVLTADRAWAAVDLGADVRLVR